MACRLQKRCVLLSATVDGFLLFMHRIDRITLTKWGPMNDTDTLCLLVLINVSLYLATITVYYGEDEDMRIRKLGTRALVVCMIAGFFYCVAKVLEMFGI